MLVLCNNKYKSYNNTIFDKRTDYETCYKTNIKIPMSLDHQRRTGDRVTHLIYAVNWGIIHYNIILVAMRPDAPYFIILLCLTPDDFIRQGDRD